MPPMPYVPPPPGPVAVTTAFLTTSERDALLVSFAAKLLLFPAYRSTDFEVHRNWLAITHSLPLTQWYFDTTSEWTLDYPPFFAYFERFMAAFAYIVDPKIVDVNNLGYDAWSVVAFQRTTVLLSELVLATALLRWARRSEKPDYPTAYIIAASVLLHPGLLIVDHIHFQYNGFLLGILLWSLVAARDGNLYLCAALFAALLNFKHIFIYLAPPFFVFLLRKHCFTAKHGFQSERLVELGLLVLSIFAISFGPFLLAGGPSQIIQIFKRLFPFQRGLNHAYWAGNVWAIVSAVDRVLVKYMINRGWPINPEALTSASRGLIGETTFGVLPEVTPVLTFSITLSISLIFLTKLWFDPTYKRFLDAVVLSAFTSFLWGWHVHEKAVLLFLVPLSLTAVDDDHHFRVYTIASCAGIYSLFPLLIKPAETPIKIIFSLIWAYLVLTSLRKVVYQPVPNLFSIAINFFERLYVAGFFFLQLYVGVIHEFIFPSPFVPFFPAAPTTMTIIETVKVCATATVDALGDALSEGLQEIKCTFVDQLVEKAVEVEAVVAPAGSGSMEFLPLMLISLYCAVGIVWAWLRLSYAYLRR